MWLPLECHQPETRPETQARALTSNRTGDPLVHRAALNSPNHTSQGYLLTLERGRERVTEREMRERERKKHRFVVLPTDAFIDCFLYVA